MTEIYLDILLPLPFDRAFTYKAHGEKVEVGDIVKVPFRKKELWGLVVGALDSVDVTPEKIKTIIAKHQTINFDTKLIDFINRVAAYNLAPRGLVLKAFIGILNSDKVKSEKLANKSLEQKVDLAIIELKTLSIKQQEIFDEILAGSDFDGAAKDFTKNPAIKNVSLIDAVTGSGKTEIYFALIAKMLQDKNSQAVILLPEIALTSQLLTRFHEQFGFKPALWHSKISMKEKREIFCGIASGSVRVLIGARSALLLPFKNLKLIVIDEEHDSSFKQEDIFNFNARDMAILKATLEKFPIILSSATPSLESYINAKSGKYNYFHLGDKFHQRSNAIEMVDLRRTKLDSGTYISQTLRKALAQNFALGQQSLLFLNRRGYAPVTLCKACGQKVNCLNCSSYLVHHKHSRRAICHYCGHNESFSHDCKSCGEKDAIINVGVGVEKIAEEVADLFPQARIALVTSDNIANFKDAEKVVTQILNNEIDIIIGTQIIAKGYDFPNLTLVGIVDADSGFYSAELKSSEKSFQLLSQVIGRAGRKDYHGKIFIQTFNPQNFVFEKIIQNDKKGFYEFEIANRKSLNMPPFTKMANFIISAFEENKALNAAKMLAAKFPFNDSIEVFGPAPTAISRLKNRYHYRVFLKTEKKINLQKLILDVMKDVDFSNQVRVKVDIDPL